MSYQQAVDYLFPRLQKGMKFGLERIQELLDRIGNPEKAFPSVHIAGTNGKGSTAALLESVLREAGYRTGLYTSPHLIDMRERIRVNGRPVSKADVVGWLDRFRPDVEAAGASYFEALTVMAFSLFKSRKIDVAVVETGLGGRLDATNVIRPLLTVITEIGIDHTNFLGRTIGSIAMEKAGILKTGVPCISGTRQKKVRGILEASAASRPCPILFSRDAVRIRNLRCTEEGSRFDADAGTSRYKNLYLKLLGAHQIDNARMVLAAVDALRKRGYRIPEKAVRSGFAKVVWRARLEVVRKDPIVLLDSAHNPAGIRSLVLALRTLFRYERLILVFGVLQDKDYRSMLKTISPLADRIVLTRPRSERAVDPKTLAGLDFLKGKDVAVVPDIPSAWTTALRSAGRRDLICCTGSMYFVGELLKILE